MKAHAAKNVIVLRDVAPEIIAGLKQGRAVTLPTVAKVGTIPPGVLSVLGAQASAHGFVANAEDSGDDTEPTPDPAESARIASGQLVAAALTPDSFGLINVPALALDDLKCGWPVEIVVNAEAESYEPAPFITLDRSQTLPVGASSLVFSECDDALMAAVASGRRFTLHLPA